MKNQGAILYQMMIILIVVLILIAIVVPYLLGSRRIENEKAAVAALKSVQSELQPTSPSDATDSDSEEYGIFNELAGVTKKGQELSSPSSYLFEVQPPTDSGDPFKSDYQFKLYLPENPALPSPEDIAVIKTCVNCHSLDGGNLVAPSFKGIFGRKSTVVTNGEERTVTADEEYLKRSMLTPTADVVKGYDPCMPEQQLNEDELRALLQYLKNLK